MLVRLRACLSLILHKPHPQNGAYAALVERQLSTVADKLAVPVATVRGIAWAHDAPAAKVRSAFPCPSLAPFSALSVGGLATAEEHLSNVHG